MEGIDYLRKACNLAFRIVIAIFTYLDKIKMFWKMLSFLITEYEKEFQNTILNYFGYLVNSPIICCG